MLLPVIALLAQTPTPGHPVALPTLYVGHRFAVTPETASGQVVRLYTDSAGGFFFSKDAAERLGLKLEDAGEQEGVKVQRTSFPAFDKKTIPAPVDDQGLPVFDTKKMIGGGELATYDGMLGQHWFAGRTWTFDYKGKKLWWRADGDLPKHDPGHESKMYFQKAPSGKHAADFARFQVTIEGTVYDFLFDTGASDSLSAEAQAFVGEKLPGTRATSFMAQNLFDKLHAAHPDWKVWDKPTTTGQKMLRVPKMTVGGWEVGPVWFSVQADYAFHDYMAQWMDQKTEGAIGGSALHYLRVTVDWPGEVAVFEKP